MTLFGRKIVATVDTIRITDLDMRFRAIKTTKPDPNTCELFIWNLNPDHRRELEQLDEVRVELEAGYQDDSGLIYSGDVNEVFSRRDGPDWVTELRSGDGSRAIRRARINRSFESGTKTFDVLDALAKEMGVDIGNAEAVIRAGASKLVGATGEFLKGVVLSGRASTEFSALLKSSGLEWSIQDGALQVTEIREAVAGFVPRLTPDSGLIGVPTIANDGILSARALMSSQIVPGRKVNVETKELSSAFYRIERSEAFGDTNGNDWYVDFEARVAA